MKIYKFFGLAAGTAVFLTIFGFWAKITHQAYADATLKTGMWVLAVCAGVFVYFVFTNLNKK